MKKIFAILLCISLVFSLVGCGNTTEVSSNDSYGSASSNVSKIQTYKTELMIPKTLAYSNNEIIEWYFPDDQLIPEESYITELLTFCGDYFFYQNELFVFDKQNGIKSVLKVDGSNRKLVTSFSVRGDIVYYSMYDDNNIYKINLKTLEKDTILNVDGSIYDSCGFSEKIYISVPLNNEIYRDDIEIGTYELKYIDLNDNIISIEKRYYIYDDVIQNVIDIDGNRFLQMRARMLCGDENYEIDLLNGEISLLTDGKTLYFVSYYHTDEFYIVNTEDFSLNKFCNFSLDFGQKAYAIGDNKVCYLSNGGDLYITDGTVTEKLVAGLPDDIKAWRIIDNIFCWYVSPESFGTVELYNAN